MGLAMVGHGEADARRPDQFEDVLAGPHLLLWSAEPLPELRPYARKPIEIHAEEPPCALHDSRERSI